MKIHEDLLFKGSASIETKQTKPRNVCAGFMLVELVPLCLIGFLPSRKEAR